jgi:ubiquinone/menaquinone biosynthesis C-methylase UbiE
MSSVHKMRRKIGVELLPWGVAEARMVHRLLSPKPGERLLEVGSSSGYRIERYSKIGLGLYGIDADHEAIEAGRVSNSAVKLIEGDACKLPFPNSFFDKVLCVHLLEHLKNPQKAIDEIARVLKPSASAVIVVPCERLRGDTAFAGWLKFKNLHLQKFTPTSISRLLSAYFKTEVALLHTLIPGRFVPFPPNRTPLTYYFSLAMVFKLRRSG